MPTPLQVCANCAAFFENHKFQKEGECRRRAPVIGAREHDFEWNAQWPFVSKNDWCLEWIKK